MAEVYWTLMDKHEYKHTQGVIACMRIKEGRALQALITERHAYSFAMLTPTKNIGLVITLLACRGS